MFGNKHSPGPNGARQHQSLFEEARPRKAMGIIGLASCAALGAAIFGGVAAVNVRLDAALNPDIVETINKNWQWNRILTTDHSITALSQRHPGMVEGACALLGAATGALHSKKR